MPAKDKKKMDKMLDQQFPVTETTGEEDDVEVTQIARLKYIPKKVRPFTAAEQKARRNSGLDIRGYKMHISAYFQGLVFNPNGSSRIVDELNGVWVKNCFEPRFVELVKEVGVDETQRGTVLEKRKWVSVPIGQSRDADAVLCVDLDVPIHYPQTVFNTCLFNSLASAFHYLGRTHTGSVLYNIAMRNESSDASSQLQAMIKAVKKDETVYKKVDIWKKEAVIARTNFLREPVEFPRVLVLRGVDGGVNHAVAVVGKIVFDSNRKKGMRLCKETFDWCCNCEGGFDRVQSAIQFRK